MRKPRGSRSSGSSSNAARPQPSTCPPTTLARKSASPNAGLWPSEASVLDPSGRGGLFPVRERLQPRHQALAEGPHQKGALLGLDSRRAPARVQPGVDEHLVTDGCELRPFE